MGTPDLTPIEAEARAIDHDGGRTGHYTADEFKAA